MLNNLHGQASPSSRRCIYSRPGSARLGLEWEKGEAYIFGENLLDKRCVSFAQPYGTSVLTGTPVYGAAYARGATIGAGTSLKF